MARLSDHVVRDAIHAAKSDIRVATQRYVRRMDELAKAHIQETIEQATNEGNAIDGTAVGKAAASRVIPSYIGDGEPRQALEASADETTSERGT